MFGKRQPAKNLSASWKMANASVAGFSHIEQSVPCQDAYAVQVTPAGFLIAVVSDGAGSARRAAEGSRIVSDFLIQAIHKTLPTSIKFDESSRATWQVYLHQRILEVRAELERTSLDGLIEEFNSTLIGTVVGANGGVFFHIGDGAACATSFDFSEAVISPPENGEFANETYFVTDPHWEQHLRVTFFPDRLTHVLLMSDGVTPFAMANGHKGPFQPFFLPVSRFLESHDQEEGERALAATLKADSIRQITGDDKTLVWAMKAV